MADSQHPLDFFGSEVDPQSIGSGEGYYLVRTDLQGRYTYVNRVFASRFGFDPQAIYNRSSLESIVVDDWTKAVTTVEKCTADPATPQLVTLRKSTSDGTILFTDWVFQAIRNEQGEVTGISCVGLDTTERERMLLNLSETLSRLNLLITTTPVVVYSYQASTKVVNFISSNVERLFGYQVKSFTGTPFPIYEQMHPEDAPHIRQQLSALPAHQKLRLEYRIYLPDGHYRWIQDDVTLLYDAEGNPKEIVGCITDIHDSKLADDLVHEQAQFLAMMEEVGHLGGWNYTPATNDLQMTKGLFELLGEVGKEDSFAIARVFDQVDERDLANAQAILTELLQYGKEIDYVHRIQRGDTTAWIRGIGKALIQDGRVERVYGIAQDITPLKERDLQLHLLRQAVEAATVGIVICSAQRADDYAVLYANSAFEQITGYCQEEIIGRNLRFLQGADRNQPDLKILRHSLQTGSECAVTLRNYHKQGHLYWIEMWISPVFDTEGKLSHFIGIQYDVTERRRAAEQAVALAAEREKTRIMQTFLQEMMHDIKTPFSVMRTSAHVIQRLADELIQKYAEPPSEAPDLEGNSPTAQMIDKLRAGVRRLQQSVIYLSDLTNRMASLSESESDVIEQKQVSFNQLVERVVSIYADVAEQHGVRLVQQLNADTGYALLNVETFGRVIQNLVENAIKYSLPGGTINVRTERSYHTIHFTVTDSGRGIAHDDLEHIFEYHYRTDDAKSSTVKGTGLGLAIVKQIVDLHGGTIEVESTLNVGTTFRVSLPGL
ncbi:MAG: PAS domain S-box protein [Chloroflexota bacterium]|nr:PAS domain S-box protein [Chloroflexota bacterium]